MHFPEWKCLNFYYDLTEVCSMMVSLPTQKCVAQPQWVNTDLWCHIQAEWVNPSPPSAAYMHQWNGSWIGLDNGLPPNRHQAITWTSTHLLSIGPLRTNFSEIQIKLQNFSFKKMHLNMLSLNWQPFCAGGDELKRTWHIILKIVWRDKNSLRYKSHWKFSFNFMLT